jgi:hypothetical protein
MTSAFRSLAATLALTAMLLRAMLPAGWMPNPDGPAGAPLVICSLAGPQQAHPGHAPQDSSGKVCPFAVVAHLAAPQLPVTVAQPAFTIWRSLAPAVYGPLAACRERAPSARAPPIPV